MATKKTNTGLNKPATPKKEVNYVVVGGKKVSKGWIAFQNNIGTGKILDMRAVLK